MEDNFNYHNIELPVEDLRKNNFGIPTQLQVCVLYSLTVILFIFIGYRVQRAEFYSGILITEFILIMLPPLIFLLLYKYDLKKVLRLNKINFSNLFIIFWIMVFAMPVVGVLNLINLALIKSIFGKVILSQLPLADNSVSLLINILVIAGSAGLCEELLFRGVIQRGFERFGIVKAILIAAFLFGLMHVDFQKLLGTFLLGALIGFIVYRTDSIFGGMFAHFTNNAVAVIITTAGNKILKAADHSGIKGVKSPASTDLDFFSLFNNYPKAYLIAIIIMYTVVFLLFAGGLIALLVTLIHNTKERAVRTVSGESKLSFRYLAWLLPGVGLIALLYLAEGLKMKGISIDWVSNMLWIIGAR
jgi:uncharacterized protein